MLSLPPLDIKGVKSTWSCSLTAVHSIPANQRLAQDTLCHLTKKKPPVLLWRSSHKSTAQTQTNTVFPVAQQRGNASPNVLSSQFIAISLVITSLDLGQHLFPVPGAATATSTFLWRPRPAPQITSQLMESGKWKPLQSILAVIDSPLLFSCFLSISEERQWRRNLTYVEHLLGARHLSPGLHEVNVLLLCHQTVSPKVLKGSQCSLNVIMFISYSPSFSKAASRYIVLTP